MATTRQQIAELLAGGLCVVDRDFSTLIQLDGDVCVSINAELLTRESSVREAAWVRHRAHVESTVRGLQRRIQAFVVLVPSVVATVGTVVIGVGRPFETRVYDMCLGVGVGGGGMWLAYRALRWWWTRAHPRAGRPKEVD
ncbi:hypothetical protein ACNOYE_13710 [Nannocystaceae bacterium ST9]